MRVVIDTNVWLVAASRKSPYNWLYGALLQRRVDVYYQFNLITDDPDDNKFADCAIASGTDYLVTFDKHFNVLKTLDFPKVTVVHPDEFKQILFDNNILKP